jgi:hypothetical protein
MSVPASWIKPLIEVIESKASVKVFGAIFLISLTALCIPRSWKDSIGMSAWVNGLWPWLVVTCAFCGLMLLFTGVDHFIIVPKSVSRAEKTESNAAENRLKKILESLGEDDKNLLYNPIKGCQMAINIGCLHYHTAKSLEKRGILSELPQGGGRGNSFAIDHATFNYLTRHPELVGIKKDS